MEYSIVRVDKENYTLFDDMVFVRTNSRKKTTEEQAEPRDFGAIYTALTDKNLHVYAAQVGDRFVGWVSAVYIPKVGKYGGKGHLFIDELWTAPAFRRHGIAYALMMEAERIARELNTAGLRLYVGGDNTGAIALYAKCGYRDRGSDAHFMDKEWDR
jgi:ribosomal protein S18 acetylase RimI-like enzyme